MTREEGQNALMLVAAVRAMATVKMDLVMV
jgi:hypothetical protein